MANTKSNQACSVPFCSNSKKKQPYLSFHSFPTDEHLKRRWILAIRRDEGAGFSVRKGSTFVCALHFKEDEVLAHNESGRKYLKSQVVPSRFQWNNWGENTPRQIQTSKRSGCDVEGTADEERECVDAAVLVQEHDYCRPPPGALDDALQKIQELEELVSHLPLSGALLDRWCVSDEDFSEKLILHSSASDTPKEMHCLLTTQSQNCYREQIQKEMLTRLAWKSRYAKLYPTCYNPQNNCTEPTQLPQLPTNPQVVPPPVTMTPKKQSDLPLPPPPVLSLEEEGQLNVPPLMRPVSPETRHALYQDSSHHGKGRGLYLQRRGHISPEEKFDFPLLSSWEYGWRLGDYTLDYRTPSHAKSSVVKNTFYTRNGVFSSPSATDTLG